jgi:hypothetical protein
MSYCRVGEGSDVYVIKHVGGYWACYCERDDNRQFSPDGMIDHLLLHRMRGDRVPQRALERLASEREGRPYETDVQRALREYDEGGAP